MFPGQGSKEIGDRWSHIGSLGLGEGILFVCGYFSFSIFHFSFLIFRNHPSTVKIGRFIVFGEGRKNGKWKMENEK